MPEKRKGNIFVRAILLLLLVGVAFTIGVFVGDTDGSQNGNRTMPLLETNQPEEVNFAPLWEAWQIVEENYAASTGTIPTDQELVWGTIGGLVESLDDPYSIFLEPDDLSTFEGSINGNFGGVGMEVGERDDVLTVIAPLEGTPADEAGIRAGDRILAIDGTVTADMSIDEAILLIRGTPGTEVVLTLARENANGEREVLEIPVRRSIITIPSLTTELLSPNVFMIRVFNFSAHAPEDFRFALREFIGRGTDNLIIDLRGNPGGFLSASVDMASWFLPQGEVVVSEQGKQVDDALVFRSRGYDIFSDELDLVVLIDGGSASAAEILAGALQEHGIATLVGTQSFGKGSVQELMDISSGGALKITTGQWLTPNGQSLSESGLTPDVIVELPDDILTQETTGTVDAQMQAAIDIVTNDDSVQ